MATAWLVGAGGALLAGILLCAGVAKLAVPAHLGRAIGELVPAAKDRAVLVARLIGVTEAGTALALSMPATRHVGAGAAAVLGAAFAVAGAIAALRGSKSSCGCFGRAGNRPLGPPNVAFGLGVAVLSGLLLRDGSGGWAAHEGLPMLGTATVAVLLSGWIYRDVIKDLGRPLRARAHRPARSTGS